MSVSQQKLRIGAPGKTIRVLVTGATAGIGEHTSKQLASAGHDVIVHGRTEAKARRVTDEIRAAHPGAAVSAAVCDLSSLAAVRTWAEELKRQEPIDVLINNAGVWLNKRVTTVDGFETTWAVNHLAPFLLTTLLLDRLLERPQSRVINVSSSGHTSGSIAFDDPNLNRGFNAIRAYCQSKLANVLFTQELARRTAGSGLVTHALHPGAVKTKLLSDTGFSPSNQRTAADGAATSVYLATDDAIGKTSGGYFVDSAPRAPATMDAALARRLWTLSEQQCALAL